MGNLIIVRVINHDFVSIGKFGDVEIFKCKCCNPSRYMVKQNNSVIWHGFDKSEIEKILSKYSVQLKA